MKDPAKDAEPVEDHHPASILKGACNLHSTKDVEDKIKPMGSRVRTYLEVFGELPPAVSCNKLVQMDQKLKREFVAHKMRCRLYPTPKQQADEIER